MATIIIGNANTTEDLGVVTNSTVTVGNGDDNLTFDTGSSGDTITIGEHTQLPHPFLRSGQLHRHQPARRFEQRPRHEHQHANLSHPPRRRRHGSPCPA